MTQTEQHAGGNAAPAAPKPQEIEVSVNERPVVLIGHKQTGLSIKQAAINQSVPIQIDFILSIERGPGHTQVINDNEEITVTRNSRFVAISDDDNS
jgi:hypothetical protein